MDILVGCRGWKWQAEGLEEDQRGDFEGGRGRGRRGFRGLDEGT